MNDQDRKQLEEIKTRLQESQTEIEDLANDLDVKTANVEEYFEGTEKAERMREQADTVEGLALSLTDLVTEFEEAISEGVK